MAEGVLKPGMRRVRIERDMGRSMAQPNEFMTLPSASRTSTPRRNFWGTYCRLGQVSITIFLYVGKVGTRKGHRESSSRY